MLIRGLEKRTKVCTVLSNNPGFILIALLFAAAFFASGCSTISKADCIAMDWFELGRTDGMDGKPRSTFQERAKPCLKHGVIPDRRAYYAGHDEGLSVYCTEYNGFDLGRQGLPYKSICPDESGSNFRKGYEDGIRLYCTEENGYSVGASGKPYEWVCPPQLEAQFLEGYERGRKLFEYQSRVTHLEKRLLWADHEIRHRETMLYNADWSDEQRSNLLLELRALDAERRNLELQLREAIRDLEDYEASI